MYSFYNGLYDGLYVEPVPHACPAKGSHQLPPIFWQPVPQCCNLQNELCLRAVALDSILDRFWRPVCVKKGTIPRKQKLFLNNPLPNESKLTRVSWAVPGRVKKDTISVMLNRNIHGANFDSLGEGSTHRCLAIRQMVSFFTQTGNRKKKGQKRNRNTDNEALRDEARNTKPWLKQVQSCTCTDGTLFAGQS